MLDAERLENTLLLAERLENTLLLAELSVWISKVFSKRSASSMF